MFPLCRSKYGREPLLARSSRVPVHTLTSTLAPADNQRPDAEDARAAQRRRQRTRAVCSIALSYAFDALLLALLAATGALVPWVAPAYLAAGVLLCTVQAALTRRRASDEAHDPYLTVPFTLAAIAVQLATMVAAPQVGLLPLLILLVIFGYAALRMSPSLGITLGVMALLPVATTIVLVGDQLALPAATLSQRLICAAWVTAVLARCIALGLMASHLRARLADRQVQLGEAMTQLERVAHRDELTGALNRRRMMALLAEEQRLQQTGGSSFAVVLFDLDHFKRINDAFGHQTGDEVLRRFTTLVLASARGADRLSRHGGEEFLLLLPNVSDLAIATAVAERVRAAVAGFEWPRLAPGLAVTTSAGVALAQRGEPTATLIARADAALYRAKHQGRDRVGS